MKWKDEAPGLCCNNGKVYLPLPKPPSESFYSLLKGENPHSEHFHSNKRQYNNCFEITLLGAKKVKRGSFMPTFKAQGQVYDLIVLNREPSFFQIYFVGDEERECSFRCNHAPSVKPCLVSQLQKAFHDCNPYIKDLKTAMENLPDGKDFQMLITVDPKPQNAHKGRYNKPKTSEVALVVLGQTCEKRDIVLRGRDTRLTRISETHRSYDALQYTLKFFHGEDGYSINIL